MPSASHSFNQFILPIENGFVFVDHGDASPRAFAFEKVVRGKRNQQIASFRFPGGVGQNYTGAAMGELAKTDNGYLFCGSYNQFEGDAKHKYQHDLQWRKDTSQGIPYQWQQLYQAA